MWRLEGALRHYAWGSATALPEFLGRAPDGRPWAELWFGAHPAGPARVAGTGQRLDEAIAQDPGLLGEAVRRGFEGHLPYLLKVIAPARPLSLQVHPTRGHASESFAAENAAGLPMDAPQRNYTDARHKPEMLVALSSFQALCGFRTPRRAATMLEGLGTGLSERLHALLVGRPDAHGMRAAFRTLVSPTLRPDAEAVTGIAQACARRLAQDRSPSPRIDATVAGLQEHFPGDPGVVAALLLNPVSLRPGEAMFVPAGAIHAYLSGLGVEVSAASDNVLRAGLTAKKIDAEEMLRSVSVQAAPPVRIAPEHPTSHTAVYYAPVDDFELAVTTVGAADGGAAIPGSGPRVLLGLDGEVTVHENPAGEDTAVGEEHVLQRGEALFVPATVGPVEVRGSGTAAQASVP